MKLNQSFGNGESKNCFIDEVCFACSKRLKNGIYFTCGIKTVILAMFCFLASSINSFATPRGLFYIFFFHNKKGLYKFAETYQGRGGLQPSPFLESASYLKAHSYFPNLKSYFEAHNIKILVGFLPTPFQAFRIPLCNPSLITIQI